MKNTFTTIALCFLQAFAFGQNKAQVKQFDTGLEPYINIRDFCMSQDKTEAYFSVQSPMQNVSQIAYIKKENGTWTEPQLMPFSDQFMYMEPFLHPNQNTLYFVSDRPLNEAKNKKKDFDIWYVTRENKTAAWSKPVNMGAPINTESDEFYPTISEHNNLYLTKVAPDGMGKDDIYVCKWQNGTYLPPVLLSEHINSQGYEFNAFISKDESFLLYSKYNAKGAQGSGDLFMAKKDKTGQWQKAVNLGDQINTKYMEYCPFYDEQNKVLYFTSKRNSLKGKKVKSLAELQQYIATGENGLSKIYYKFITL
ncbi:hypothetical protein OOZ15_07620 [Galbibacter sp. EGI 63066]|uniref:hypothetical protein n=1 Tax=Galbibacter sp. EGI 63066 TaxID=2993559 RepID=UPI002248E667|nr:hypothetical protein [Galbibacter sp. EGI 63066]MCX2679801.1 hypothetical protein [Galbibacter sp. EGI 63066]